MRRVIAVGVIAVAFSGCGRKPKSAANVVPSYDPKTGKLTKLSADLNRNGTPDTWTYMDGARTIRTEQDKNEDGRIDRWEYLNPDGTLQRATMSASGDPGKLTRWETYEQGILVLVEEDTNGDGRPDKWEKHRGAAIVSVEFDLNFDGVADQRLTYGPEGTVVSIETGPDGQGGYMKKAVPGQK